MTISNSQKEYVADLIGLSCSIVLDKGHNLWDSVDHRDCVALQVIFIQTGVEAYDATGILDPNIVASAYNLFSNFYNQINDDSRTFFYGNIKDELSRISLNG